jgi:hypothetical protein
MGPQRRRGIYIGYDSPSIIRYLEPTTADVFKSRFQDCQFCETIFPKLTNSPDPLPATVIKWQSDDTFWRDPRTNLANDEVRRILHLQQIMEKLPDSFTDAATVTKSHVEAANTPARIQISDQLATDISPKKKRGRPPGSKDTRPRTKRTSISTLATTHMDNEEISVQYSHTGTVWERSSTELNDLFSFLIYKAITEELPDPKSVKEAQQRPDWKHWEVAINSELDSLITRQVFGPIIKVSQDTHLTGYRITLVRKRNAHGQVVRYKARLVAKGYTQVYGQDYDLTHAPVMDSITYRFLISFAIHHKLRMHLMDVVTAYLYGLLDTDIYMQAPPELLTRLIFHVQGEKSTPLSAELQSGINRTLTEDMRITLLQHAPSNLQGMVGHAPSNLQGMIGHAPSNLQGMIGHEPSKHQVMPSDRNICAPPTKQQSNVSEKQEHQPSVNTDHIPTKQRGKQENIQKFAVQVLRSIYGLKQSGRIWYQRFKSEMLNLGFVTAEIAPCLFIKQAGTEFIILAIYVDDISIFGTRKITSETVDLLKRTFEMKDVGQPNFCLGIQFEYLTDGIFIHQSTYTRKLLKQFNMDKCHPVTTPMEQRSLDPNKDIFKKCTENELTLGPEKPYLSVIGGLMFLGNQTRPDISFSVNMLARHSSKPTIRHWNGTKRIMRYLQGSIDTGLYFPYTMTNELCGYADAGYLSDPDDSKSQTGYVFLQGGTAISWKSSKQTLTTTSSNHAEVIALYEACRECIWLRQMIDHICTSTGRETLQKPTLIYEDNRPCVDQIAKGFIKGDRIKHIAPKFFYTAEQHGDKIQVEWIPSKENKADLFTKPLPRILHAEHMQGIGMRSLSKLQQTTRDDNEPPRRQSDFQQGSLP